jgi:hypothetical protein
MAPVLVVINLAVFVQMIQEVTVVFCPPMALSVVTDEMTWRAFWMEMFG